MKENLGKLGKDKITGFTGIITAIAFYLTGCNQYSLVSQKLKEDGSTVDPHWFDVKRVDILSFGISKSDVMDVANPGGPQSNPNGRQG